jgi:hypothetical protein
VHQEGKGRLPETSAFTKDIGGEDADEGGKQDA